MTLRARLTTVFVAVVVIPLVVGTVLLASALPRAFSDQQGASLRSLAAVGAEVVRGLCDQAAGAAEAAGRGVLAFPAAAVDEQQDVLRSLVERGLADGLRVTDGAGRVAVVGQVPDSSPDCSAVGAAAPGVAAGVRLEQAGTGAAQAVAVVGLDDALLARLSRGTGAEVAVLVDGRVVASTADVPGELLSRAVASPGEPVTAEDRTAVLAPATDGQPLGLLVSQPVDGGLSLVGTAVAVVLGAAMLAALLALWLARATVRPLEELGEAAARVASGDLSTTIAVRGQDEVGQLASAFNTMTDELREHVGALEASRDELRAGLARLGQTLTSTHDLDRILGVVLETALASTTARSGAVLLREHDGGGLVLAAGRGLPEVSAGPGVRVPSGEGAIGRVALDGVARRAEVPDDDAFPLDPSARRVLAVPLRASELVLGVLVLYDPRSEDAGDADDLLTLRTLADQAAVAVENVLRHRDVSRMAVTDALTGLANYRSFTDTIAREVERANRFGRPVGLVLLDIDHFKHVNDTLGHQRGDAVLVELAQRVRSQVRDVDTVARYGGEELVVVLPETDVHGAEQAAERIRSAVAAAPFGELPDVPVHVTVSLGVSVHGVHATTASSLLRRADEALYAAKGAGRNTWRTARVGPAVDPAVDPTADRGADDPVEAPH